MRLFVRNALLGTAGLIALSLPASAIGPTSIAEGPLFKSSTAQLVQYYGTSSGSVGYKKPKKKKTKK